MMQARVRLSICEIPEREWLGLPRGNLRVLEGASVVSLHKNTPAPEAASFAFYSADSLSTKGAERKAAKSRQRRREDTKTRCLSSLSSNQ